MLEITIKDDGKVVHEAECDAVLLAEFKESDSDIHTLLQGASEPEIGYAMMEQCVRLMGVALFDESGDE